MTAITTVAGDTERLIRELIDANIEDIARHVEEGTIPRIHALRAIEDVLREAKEGRVVLGDCLELVPPLLNLTAVREFDVGKRIKVGEKIGECEITYVGPGFQKQFGHVIERDVPARRLPVWHLRKALRNPTIVKLLGGMPMAQMAIAHAVQVIERGRRGPGLFDGHANIGYKDACAFDWRVSGRSLEWSGRSVSHLSGWLGGHGIYGG